MDQDEQLGDVINSSCTYIHCEATYEHYVIFGQYDCLTVWDDPIMRLMQTVLMAESQCELSIQQ